jgi:hypothetical protein
MGESKRTHFHEKSHIVLLLTSHPITQSFVIWPHSYKEGWKDGLFPGSVYPVYLSELEYCPNCWQDYKTVQLTVENSLSAPQKVKHKLACDSTNPFQCRPKRIENIHPHKNLNVCSSIIHNSQNNTLNVHQCPYISEIGYYGIPRHRYTAWHWQEQPLPCATVWMEPCW